MQAAAERASTELWWAWAGAYSRRAPRVCPGQSLGYARCGHRVASLALGFSPGENRTLGALHERS